MQVYKGVSASPGLVMGPIYRIHHSGAGLGRIVELPVREQALFDAAVVLAKDELRQLEEAAEGEDRDIILFQRVMLDDPALNREVQEYIAAGAGSAAVSIVSDSSKDKRRLILCFISSSCFFQVQPRLQAVPLCRHSFGHMLSA